MSTTTAIAPLQVRRTIDARPEEVWAAWTEADMLAAWFAPGVMRAEVLALDVRVGGLYRIRMTGGEGEHIVSGAFTEVNPIERLAMTWSWEDGLSKDTRVTVSFAPREAGTEITILHEGLPTEDAVNQHRQRWNGCLDNLAACKS